MRNAMYKSLTCCPVHHERLCRSPGVRQWSCPTRGCSYQEPYTADPEWIAFLGRRGLLKLIR